MLAAGGAILEELLDDSGTTIHIQVTRGQMKLETRANGTYAFYARHTLHGRHGISTHKWLEPLAPSRALRLRHRHL